MYTVYQFVNKNNGRKYYGITKNLRTRLASHKYAALRGYKSPFYCAVRKHGWDNFEVVVLHEGLSPEDAGKIEIDLIAGDTNCYNLHLGGKIGFDASTLPEDRKENWLANMRKARQGRKPALGMRHTEENKKLFAESSRKYWDNQETYNWDEIKHLSFREASKQFGISKTHYHRLRKRNGISDSV
jgi:group I intron endonuclease